MFGVLSLLVIYSVVSYVQINYDTILAFITYFVIFFGVTIFLIWFMKCVLEEEKVQTGNIYKRHQCCYVNKIRKHKRSWSLYVQLVMALLVVIVGLFFLIGLLYVVFQDKQYVMDNIYVLYILLADKTSFEWVVGAYTIILTLVSLTSSYLKGRCILYEIDEVPNVKMAIKITYVSVITFILNILFDNFICKIVDNFTYRIIIRVIIKSLWLLFIAISIGFLLIAVVKAYVRKIEKNLMEDIHKLYWNKRLYNLPNKEWYRGNLTINEGSLLNNFWKKCKKIKIDNINYFDFGSVYHNKPYSLGVVRRKIIIFCIYWAGIMAFFSLLVIPQQFTGTNINCEALTLLQIILLISVIMSASIIIRFLKDNPNKLINFNFLYFDNWGYFFDDGKLRYCSTYDKQNSLYGKYILAIKNLVSFFNLGKHMKYVDMKENQVESYYIEEMIEFSKDHIDNKKIKHMLIPITICATLCKKEDEEMINKIQNLVTRFQLKNNERNYIKSVAMAILRDLEGDDEEYYKNEKIYNDSIENLLMDKRIRC